MPSSRGGDDRFNACLDDEMTTSTIIPRGARMNGPGWLTYCLGGLPAIKVGLKKAAQSISGGSK
jgi:hypothetical protein